MSRPAWRAGNGRRLPCLPALVERSSSLVLDQNLEPPDPAGLPWVCLVRVLLEPDELQHELLRRNKFKTLAPRRRGDAEKTREKGCLAGIFLRKPVWWRVAQVEDGDLSDGVNSEGL